MRKIREQISWALIGQARQLKVWLEINDKPTIDALRLHNEMIELRWKKDILSDSFKDILIFTSTKRDKYNNKLWNLKKENYSWWRERAKGMGRRVGGLKLKWNISPSFIDNF